MSTPEAPAKSPGRRHWTVGAAVVAVIGLLILTTSGLCTGIFGLGMIYSVVSEAGSLKGDAILAVLSGLGTVLVFGGIPMLVGFFLTRWGFRMRKKD